MGLRLWRRAAAFRRGVFGQRTRCRKTYASTGHWANSAPVFLSNSLTKQSLHGDVRQQSVQKKGASLMSVHAQDGGAAV